MVSVGPELPLAMYVERSAGVREAILASPDDLEKILDDYNRRNAEQARKNHDDKRFAQAKEKMGPGEEEIIMYGQRFWPVIDNRMGAYDYPTLCLAIWHFQDQLRWLSMSRAGESIGVPGHHASAWNQVALPTRATGGARRQDRQRLRMFCTIIGTLADEYAANPTGECRPPVTPKIEALSFR